MRTSLPLLACLACTSVNQEFRCQDSTACLLDDTYGQCEDNGYCSFFDPSCFESQRRYGPYSGTLTDTCVGDEPPPPDAGGPDQPIPPDQRPPNDDMDSATRIQDSGSYPFDLRNATSSGFGFCGSDAPDVFFTFDVFDTEVIYLDTLGTETSFALGCRDSGTEGNCADSSCGDDPKGGQLAQVLEPGNYCVQVFGDVSGTLRFVRGGRAGTRLNPEGGNFFDTCSAPNLAAPSCGEPEPDGGGGEDAFFTTTCGSSSVSALTGDGVIAYLRQGWSFSSDLACGIGGFEEMVGSAGLYWVFVEGTLGCSSGTVTWYGP